MGRGSATLKGGGCSRKLSGYCSAKTAIFDQTQLYGSLRRWLWTPCASSFSVFYPGRGPCDPAVDRSPGPRERMVSQPGCHADRERSWRSSGVKQLRIQPALRHTASPTSLESDDLLD